LVSNLNVRVASVGYETKDLAAGCHKNPAPWTAVSDLPVMALPIEVAAEAITMEAVVVVTVADTNHMGAAKTTEIDLLVAIGDTNHMGAAEITEIDLLVEGAVLDLPATAFKRLVRHPSIQKQPWRSN
jgi:hypothetical protein